MPLSEIYDYFRTYDKASYEVFAQHGSEPHEADIAGFEQRIGFELPSEFREYAQHPLGGLYMEVREELWPRPELYDVGPFWSFLYGFFVHSLSADAPDWMHMETEWRKFSESGFPNLVPFLTIIGDADRYGFTPDGRIVIWRHEEPDDPEIVSDSFSECVMREIRSLEERKERKVRGEDRQSDE